MPSTVDIPPLRRRTVAETALLVSSVLLSLTGIFALGPLSKIAELDSLVPALIGGAPLPKPNAATNAARLGMLGSTLGILGSVAALVYLSKRRAWARNVALAVWMLAIGTSSLLAIQGSTVLVANPARGDFSGLANLGTLVLHVIMPGVFALMSLIVIVCLMMVRPQQRQKPM